MDCLMNYDSWRLLPLLDENFSSIFFCKPLNLTCSLATFNLCTLSPKIWVKKTGAMCDIFIGPFFGGNHLDMSNDSASLGEVKFCIWTNQWIRLKPFFHLTFTTFRY